MKVFLLLLVFFSALSSCKTAAPNGYAGDTPPERMDKRQYKAWRKDERPPTLEEYAELSPRLQQKWFKKISDPQYHDPMYFGEKRPPKKRKKSK
ncbi:MAG: hypothetical protein AAF740_09135 [Bacteroidota bacterium]